MIDDVSMGLKLLFLAFLVRERKGFDTKHRKKNATVLLVRAAVW